MSNSSPWDLIAVPTADLNVRQVDRRTGAPCFRARNSAGAYVFVIELEGDHETEFRSGRQYIHGIGLDLQAAPEGRQRLLLTLERQHDRDLFGSLCETLVSALELATDSPTALSITLQHLRRWKAFLAGRPGVLSAEEVQGLFAELTFLQELLGHGSSQGAVLGSWRGPEHSQQDFIYGDSAVEIKSLSGIERNSVRISSEDQLETLQGRLFLRLYRLSALPDAPHAQSLNDKVAAIQQQLGDADAVDSFNKLLGMHRYAPLPTYDQPQFALSGIRTYRIGDGFPRIVRSALPQGISHVGYDLKLETIALFECSGVDVFEGI